MKIITKYWEIVLQSPLKKLVTFLVRELFKLNPENSARVRCLKTFCCVLIQRQPKSPNYTSLMAFLFTLLSLCPESQHVHLNASHVPPEPRLSRCETDWHRSESAAALLAWVINGRAVAFPLCPACFCDCIHTDTFFHELTRTQSVSAHMHNVSSSRLDINLFQSETTRESLSPSDSSQWPWCQLCMLFIPAHEKKETPREKGSIRKLQSMNKMYERNNKKDEWICMTTVKTREKDERMSESWQKSEAVCVFVCVWRPSGALLMSAKLSTNPALSLLLSLPYFLLYPWHPPPHPPLLLCTPSSTVKAYPLNCYKSW